MRVGMKNYRRVIRGLRANIRTAELDGDVFAYHRLLKLLLEYQLVTFERES